MVISKFVDLFEITILSFFWALKNFFLHKTDTFSYDENVKILSVLHW